MREKRELPFGPFNFWTALKSTLPIAGIPELSLNCSVRPANCSPFRGNFGARSSSGNFLFSQFLTVSLFHSTKGP